MCWSPPIVRRGLLPFTSLGQIRELGDFCLTPSLDATPKNLRTSAVGAAIAANRGVELTAISSLDDVTLKRSHLESSRSGRADGGQGEGLPWR